VNTIGWQTFTTTFTATAAFSHIVIGNCDGTGNGGNLFCNFTLSNAVVFPVELQDFSADANDCQVDLNWTIDNDGNVLDHFEVVKSIEGRADEVVAQLPAQTVTNVYQFTDLAPSLNCDYQLKVRYRDGTTTLSEVVHVQTECEDLPNAFENNPVHGNEAVLRYRSAGGPLELTLRNIEGRIVYREEIAASEAGWKRLTLDVSRLQPGIYFASMGDGQVTRLLLMR
jgi:hypothetical protein